MKMTRKYDFLVIGSGIAGISFAIKASAYGKVALITKSKLDDTNTSYAQGGIAAVTYEPDNFEKHIEDTLIAGDGHCNKQIVRRVIENAPTLIQELLKWGVDFDRDQTGNFDLHREGGHSENRILHHKDNTGYEIQQSLIKKLQEIGRAHV